MHRGASLAAGTVHLGDVERDAVRQIDVAVGERVSTRLRARDASLWSADPDTTELISQRLGWVDGPTRVDPVSRAAGPVLLLGMGGSSLGALALAAAHGVDDGLHVLDSTVPATVQAATRRKFSDIVVASKSGSTIETACLAAAFESRFPAARFRAVTDPGSALAQRAAGAGYASCQLNPADIGGRFSVLSAFGQVPARLAGIDMERVNRSAAAMMERCVVDRADNPGLVLGAALAAAARRGRDKLTLLADPGLEELTDWIEQLVAESTGKQGRGIVPLTRETPAMLARHHAQRFVVELRWDANDGPRAVFPDEVPRLRYSLPDPAAIGGEFYRWQVAVALAGRWLGVNPFDEPDVALAKRRTAAMLEAFETEGALPRPAEQRREGLTLLGEAPADALASVLGRPAEGGYIGVLAFLPETERAHDGLAELRELLGERCPVALGWGPRYLHSSGQLHKGGPATGSFLLLTAEAEEDIEIPDRSWGFGTLACAQALGDAASLRERGRPVVHAHLDAIGAGLRQIVALLR